MKKSTAFAIAIKSALVALALSGCNPKSGSLETNGSSSLMAPPKEGTSMIRSQLTRYRGQTEFLTAVAGYSTRGGRLEMAAAPASAVGGAPRAEQESDVFKVGKPGSKLLYLLNNYRGLQVVSYVDGTNSPKLLGRAEPTGNYPSDMYLDPSQDRIFVLERVWFDSQNNSYTQNQSRILIYDVSKPENPTLSEKIEIKGEIADSRMVGNVLYVVSTLRPDSNSYRYNSNVSPSQGIVASFDLSGSKINKIQELNLTLPAVYGTNLRVVTVPEGNSYKYYLMAHLSEHGWGWWDRKGMVQVIDISDDKGKISPIMTVSVKGTIQRPHQMQIKNNTLIVVSNYIPGETNAAVPGQPSAPRIARIAVETFKFPTTQSEVLSENEAELRRLYIEKQVALETAKGVVSEVSRQKWVKDPTWGIEGRFVLSKEQVRKIMPDSLVTTGDTTGLSANLQDVRIYGDWLYAFWVPANQVDPLDLFDISSPENGIRHIQRLTFDGWISRAEPISYNGKNYIIGLGWIVPAVNNENNKRYAQVKLFEIVKTSKAVKATEVTSLVLSQSQFWANFNGQDKFIEFKQMADGKGEILFEGSRYGMNDKGISTYQDGGQIISFDLSQSDSDNIFKEGSFLAGDSTWIKRIFTNSEINRINSFSDSSLVTFGPNANTPSSTVEAAHVLELARNIKGYVNLGDNGLQIIGEGNDWSYDGNAKTILRSVSKSHVDAEKSEALNETVLSGAYATHLMAIDGKSILVLTNKNTMTDRKYSQTYQLHQLSIEGTKGVKLVSSEPWGPAADVNRVSIRVANSVGLVAPSYYGQTTSFFTLPTGEIMVSVGGELKLVETKSALTVKNVEIEKCGLTKEDQSEVKTFNGQLYLFKRTIVDIRKEIKTYGQGYTHNLIALTWANQKLTCGESINVPGTVLAFDGQTIVSSDSWVTDIYALNEQEALSTATGLTSLKIIKSEKGTKASLVDMIEAKENSDLSYIALPKSFSQTLSLMKYNSKSDTGSGAGVVDVVAADKDAFLTQASYTLPNVIPYGRLAKVFEDSKNQGTFYGVVKSWRQIQVIQFRANGDSRPKLVPLAAVNWKNVKEKPVLTVNVLEGYSSTNDGIHFSPEQKSLEISSGMFGVKQFFLGQ